MRCIALQHVCFEDLGVFAPVLADFGFSTESRQAGVAPISKSEWISADLVVVLGGPIGVYEEDKYPWILDEIDGLRSRLARQAPTIGICLGAQLMAAALGARVYPGSGKEIGWARVDLADSERRSSLSHLRDIEVLHWHGDTFDLPVGSTLLASTAHTPHQAFSVGDFALAIQFHPEVDGAHFERWLIGHTCELAHARISVRELRLQTERSARRCATAGQAMLADWLAQLGSASRRACTERRD
ncbi:MAG: glutamine amidotransferase [Burkholderiaceae bacterium]|jgi:GMP synthase (glutamine-hydrolysing)